MNKLTEIWKDHFYINQVSEYKLKIFSSILYTDVFI